jgi:hypothetical protein
MAVMQETRKFHLNPRMLVLLLLIVVPVGWIVWTFADQALSGGISDKGDYKLVNLKAMGNFPFNDVTGTLNDVPPQFRGLDGQKVIFEGQMYVDYTTAPQVERFQLVYSIQDCCFNGPPKVQERVFAFAKKPVPVYNQLARVYGTLHIRTKTENGKIVSVFDMDVEKVEAI